MNNILKAALIVLCAPFSLCAQKFLPVAHYKFNGDVKDSSPFENHGSVVGILELTKDRFGNNGGAINFSGNGNSYIEIPSSPSLESPVSQITITGWFKLKAHNYSNYWLTMVCKGQNIEETALNPQYRFQITQNYKPQLSRCSPDIEQGYSVISLNSEAIICDTEFMTHKFEPEVWHFYAITYNGSEISIYYDGLKASYLPFSSSLNVNSSPLFIGKDIPGIIDDFRGALDDIRIYNRGLTEMEVYEIFSEPSIKSFDSTIKSQQINNGIQLTKLKQEAININSKLE